MLILQTPLSENRERQPFLSRKTSKQHQVGECLKARILIEQLLIINGKRTVNCILNRFVR